MATGSEIETEEPSDGIRFERVPTAGDALVGQLRQAIATGRLRPGEILGQEDLARRFGTSRAPLREALRQLAGEGLVDWRSRRKAIVTSLTVAQIEELFEMGAVLEALATRHGVPHLDDADIARLTDLLDAMEAPGLDMADWYPFNHEFHRLPMARSGMSHVLEKVDETRRNLARYFVTAELYEHAASDWKSRHHAEHRTLLQAFEKRDANDAARLMEAHWRSTWRSWAAYFDAVGAAAASQ